MAMVHRVRRELSSCASFSAESQHRPRPPEMARHPHRPRTQQPGDACRPPSACSSAAPGALGLSRGGSPVPCAPRVPPSGFPARRGPCSWPASLSLQARAPRGKSCLSLGIREPGTPPSGESLGGDCPRARGRASEAEKPETFLAPTPLTLLGPQGPYWSLDCLSSLESTHPGHPCL